MTSNTEPNSFASDLEDPSWKGGPERKESLEELNAKAKAMRAKAAKTRHKAKVDLDEVPFDLNADPAEIVEAAEALGTTIPLSDSAEEPASESEPTVRDAEAVARQARAEAEEARLRIVPGHFFRLEGDFITLSLKDPLEEDTFLVTGLLRGMMGNLDYSRVNTARMWENMEAREHERNGDNENREVHPSTQEWYDKFKHQLENIAGVSEDLNEFWTQVDHPANLSIHPRTDAQILVSIMDREDKKRQDGERLLTAATGSTQDRKARLMARLAML